MTIRRGLLVLVAGVALTAAAAGTAVATAVAAPPPSSIAAPPEVASRTAFVLGGIAFGYLPTGLGGPTDFDYSFEGVDFTSRVWESGSDQAGWQVDLDIEVLHGARLSSGRALHDWFIKYEDRPTAEAHYVATRINGHPGWLCRDQVFWLLRPGLAVSVRLDRNRWAQSEVVRIADAARMA